ncbi:TetR/AcrR family transcriptional regulator [Rhodococcus tibetensis]|uniref:TetR/AcrR family transcriptional regulator n=1 Tax=Rhodococcus tibetensis TaxID=2965064 RepID=A0ABT1QH45_9NOCA|nr:TetR/AcrR family transcriptional regulator [Rhodococcus sp. FXJ9.536]MCQ4121604.1 TetR/AcrR family transcriptional regulator [Rhodococcus sp. FXJ9.536]
MTLREDGPTVTEPEYADWRTFEALSLTPILEQALDLFNENGYHGTTVRQIARRVGVTVPALYYHHESKEAILVALFELQMRELNDRAEAAACDAGADDVVAQFSNVVEAIVLYMTHRVRHVCLDTELRHVSADSRSRYAATRKRLELMVIDLVTEGVATGEFHATHVAETARALLGMCQSIPRWYQSGGALTPDQVAARYVDIALHTVGGSAARARLTSFWTP